MNPAWQDEVEEISPDCHVCGMICTSFPPLHVMQMATQLIPRVSCEGRLEIAKRRDPDSYQSDQALACPPAYIKVHFHFSSQWYPTMTPRWNLTISLQVKQS